MNSLKAALEAIGAFFKWLSGRQSNDPEIRTNKKAQQEQETNNEIARLTGIMMHHPDPEQRRIAKQRIREMQSE